MFEALTTFLPGLQDVENGIWISDKKNDGSPEHPKQFSFVAYDKTVIDLEQAIYQFIYDHKEMELTRYGEILAASNIEWSSDSMKKADVSVLDGRTVMALLVGTIRAERFCDGALLAFCEDGSIVKWLQRLKEIDLETRNGYR